jgi:hypothetical protein
MVQAQAEIEGKKRPHKLKCDASKFSIGKQVCSSAISSLLYDWQTQFMA